MPILIATENGRRYTLGKGENLLGRHPQCHIVVPDDGTYSVSREHARIQCEGEICYLEDRGSRNGTFLNGQRITGRRRLSPGDAIRLYSTEFTFYQSANWEYIPEVDRENGSHSSVLTEMAISSDEFPEGVPPQVKLKVITEVMRQLSPAVALNEVLPQVLDSLHRIFEHAERGFIVMQAEDGSLLPRWQRIWLEDTTQTIRISRTLVRHVMDTQVGIILVDLQEDPSFKQNETIIESNIRSMMCAPLVDSDGRSFGVLQLDTVDQRHRFRNEDLELLIAFASYASVAIHNAQLHDEALAQQEALHRMNLRQQKIEGELESARRVQQSFLPKHRPRLENYHFFDYYRPMEEVGGDYYDYLEFPDGRLCILVADVQGHGLPAALLMAKLSSEARFYLAQHEPGPALTRLSSAINELASADKFVTFVAVLLDPRRHEVIVANAGHPCPLLHKANGAIVKIGEHEKGVPLGVLEGYQYGQAVASFEKNDMLVLFTDGIFEAYSPGEEGVQYSLPRLEKLIQQPETRRLLGENIIADVSRHVGSEQFDDDLCLVCFGRN